MARQRVLCMCGMDLGHRIAGFLLKTGIDPMFVVNSGETTGQWYRTPLELDIQTIPADQAISWKPDLVITAFYHRLLSPALYRIPSLGAWNVHLADAERYRGAFPSIRALINGDATYSATIHRIDSGIDSGDILAKTEFPIPAGSTGRDLYFLMVEKGEELFRQHWPDLLSGRAVNMTREQDGSRAETMFRRDLTHRVEPDPDLVRRVLALTFPPFPPPFFTAGGRRYIIIPDPDEDEEAPN